MAWLGDGKKVERALDEVRSLQEQVRRLRFENSDLKRQLSAKMKRAPEPESPQAGSPIDATEASFSSHTDSLGAMEEKDTPSALGTNFDSSGWDGSYPPPCPTPEILMRGSTAMIPSWVDAPCSEVTSNFMETIYPGRGDKQ
jgi:hypothetical protein